MKLEGAGGKEEARKVVGVSKIEVLGSRYKKGSF